jgi:hypothetical protein
MVGEDFGDLHMVIEETDKLGNGARVKGFVPYCHSIAIEDIPQALFVSLKNLDHFIPLVTVDPEAPKHHFQRRTLERALESVGNGGCVEEVLEGLPDLEG